MIWFKFEKALRLLVEYYPKEDQKKPSLFHSIRTGTYLYNKDYSEDIQVAWLLHDALEDTDMPESIISDNFWTNILQITIANSKTKNISKDIVLEDIIQKCVSYGEDALIVKMADVYDNFLFYVNENIALEIDRCIYLAKLIMIHKLNTRNDPIFNLSKEILNYKTS